MSGKKVYGRAYPITAADAKAYRRVERRVRPNPIGVTAMASINGRGSARSARAVAQGKTRSQRIARAESVYRNGERPMAGVLKNKRKSSAKKKPSARRKISGTGFYKTKGGRYQNAKGKFVKASAVKSSTTRKRKKTTSAPVRRKRRATAKTATPVRRRRRRVSATATPVRRKRRASKRRVRKNASVGYSPAYSAGHDKMTRSKSAKRASATRRRRASGSSKKTIGRYRRLSIKDPKTGRKKLSYMYRTKSGKRRKIPTKAITRSGHKTAAGVRRGRSKAAARIKREGSAFVANRSGKTSARQKRAGRRLAAFMAAKRSGKTVKQAKASALRKVPLRRGDKFKGNAKAPVTVGKTKVRRNKRKTVRRNAKRRVTRKNPYATTKRRGASMSSRSKRPTVLKKNRRRRSRRRRTTPNKRRTVKRNRRRTSMRRNGFGKMFRKNAFMANLKAALQTGLFVATGFLVHRIATNLIAEKALATTMPDNQIFQDWKKPMVGFGMLLVGIPVVGMAVPKRGIEIGAGMVASFLQSAIVAALNSAGQQEFVSAVAGYSNSRAYALRGSRRRRRGVRGIERHATSIMPRYTPVRQMGQYSQAAAGWQQAAAGAGTGEYFIAAGEYFTATGEYFAPQGTKGVGGYEPAGQLAMQASAGVNSVIRDGIRPDGDIDHVLDVAEAAAGLGDPTAIEHRVGQQSQWIPNGSLWAGERAVRDNQGTSEISAGILQRPGGNGILSGG